MPHLTGHKTINIPEIQKSQRNIFKTCVLSLGKCHCGVFLMGKTVHTHVILFPIPEYKIMAADKFTAGR